MNLQMKGIKTTIAAFIGLLSGLGLIVALVFDAISITEFSTAIGALGAFIGIIIGFLAKDQNATHSK